RIIKLTSGLQELQVQHCIRLSHLLRAAFINRSRSIQKDARSECLDSWSEQLRNIVIESFCELGAECGQSFHCSGWCYSLARRNLQSSFEGMLNHFCFGKEQAPQHGVLYIDTIEYLRSVLWLEEVRVGVSAQNVLCVSQQFLHLRYRLGLAQHRPHFVGIREVPKREAGPTCYLRRARNNRAIAEDRLRRANRAGIGFRTGKNTVMHVPFERSLDRSRHPEVGVGFAVCRQAHPCMTYVSCRGNRQRDLQRDQSIPEAVRTIRNSFFGLPVEEIKKVGEVWNLCRKECSRRRFNLGPNVLDLNIPLREEKGVIQFETILMNAHVGHLRRSFREA